MRVRVLGRSGTCPGAGSACSGYLIQAEGKNLLIDCGSGALARLQHFMPLEEIDAIVLSHLHYDHVSDIFSLKYALETLSALGMEIAQIPLLLPASPAALAQEIASGNLFAAQHTADGYETQVAGFTLRFDWMPHLIESYAVTCTHAGTKLVYSGDTGMNDRLAGIARDAHLFLCESTFASDRDPLASDHHLSAENAGKIATQASVRRLLLTHLWQRESEARYIEYAAAYYPAAEVAQEGMDYQI